jgi:hypothetical protein
VKLHACLGLRRISRDESPVHNHRGMVSITRQSVWKAYVAGHVGPGQISISVLRFLLPVLFHKIPL